MVWTVGWAWAACSEEEGCPAAGEAGQVGGKLVWEAQRTHWGESDAGRGPRTQRPPSGPSSGAVPARWPLREPPTALQDLEPQQLLLFVQSFGIPVSSMSKLLQYLDQAVAHDPQTLEQNIMDKSEHPGPGCDRTAASDPTCRSWGGVRLCGRRGEEPSSLTPRCPHRLHGAPGGGPA